MSLELIKPSEPLATDVAAEPVLFGVDRHVLCQMSSMFKTLPADGAAERSLSGVDPHVDVKVVLAAEDLPALGAAERLLSRLCISAVLYLTLVMLRGLTGALVTLELSVPGESFVAEMTAKTFLTRVDGHVIGQVDFLGEALPAEGAAEWFLSGVCPHVDLQVRTAAKDLPTLRAAVSLFTGSNSRTAGRDFDNLQGV